MIYHAYEAYEQMLAPAPMVPGCPKSGWPSSGPDYVLRDGPLPRKPDARARFNQTSPPRDTHLDRESAETSRVYLRNGSRSLRRRVCRAVVRADRSPGRRPPSGERCPADPHSIRKAEARGRSRDDHCTNLRRRGGVPKFGEA
jgi:hypothetical protein